MYQNKQSNSKQQGYPSKTAFAGYHGDVYIVYVYVCRTPNSDGTLESDGLHQSLMDGGGSLKIGHQIKICQSTELVYLM